MDQVSSLRLYALRALYVLIVVGLALVVWPGVLHHDKPWEFMEGTVKCMLVAFSLLCALGLRYPLQMLPILLWETLWKTLWLGIVALPQWWSGHLDAPLKSAIFDCSFVLLVYLAVPWDYVWKQYVRRPGDGWGWLTSRRVNEGAR
jgi:hypothetical protein